MLGGWVWFAGRLCFLGGCFLGLLVVVVVVGCGFCGGCCGLLLNVRIIYLSLYVCLSLCV